MIFPRLRLTIEAAANFESRNVASRCVASVVSHTSGDSLRMPPVTTPIPALFTRISMAPNSPSTVAIAPDSVSRSVTSRCRAIAGTPMAFNSATTWLFFSWFRESTAIAAPARAMPRAIERPIPRFPPVTTATRPLSAKGDEVLDILCSDCWGSTISWVDPLQCHAAVGLGIGFGSLGGALIAHELAHDQSAALSSLNRGRWCAGVTDIGPSAALPPLLPQR